MTAADYADWCDYAGFYLGNVSHAQRYRAYQRKVCRAGLAAVIVHDFLRQNKGGIDLQRWRNHDVYEVGPDAAYRVEQTAQALDEIGAARLAARVRTVQDTSIGGMFRQHGRDPQALREMRSNVGLPKMLEELREKLARAGLAPSEQKPVPPEPQSESWEQVEHLLGQYLAAHEQELRGDVERYGDVRRQPGFDPNVRREELQRLHRRELDREAQEEAVARMRPLMQQLEQHLAKKPGGKGGKVASLRRQLLDCYRQYSRREVDDLIPAVREWLPKAEELFGKYPAVFRPQPTTHAGLLARLAAIGAHDVDQGGGEFRIHWDSPQGLECDWAEFSLSMSFPEKDKKALTRLLDAWERVRDRFPEHQGEMRQEILESFAIHHHAMNERHRPSEESILAQAGDGHIRLEVSEETGNGVGISVFFHVPWDDEHGVEVGIPDETPEEEEAPPPPSAVPAWLQAVRDRNVAGFMAWLEAGGRLSDEYLPPGEVRRLTVLDHLARRASPDFLRELLGRKVLRPGPLCDAWVLLSRDLDRFKALLPQLPTELHHKALASPDVWDDPELLNQLLQAGADLDAGLDGEGATALHLAVRGRRPDGARWLLEHGASAGKADRYGRTALVWAESERQLESLKLLLEAGERIDSLFPHMPTMPDKLGLLKRRWFGQFDELLDYLRGRGIDLGGFERR